MRTSKGVRGARIAAGLMAALLLAGASIALTTTSLIGRHVAVATESTVHKYVFTHVEPAFRSLHEDRFSTLYMGCVNAPEATGGRRVRYIVTLQAGRLPLYMTLYQLGDEGGRLLAVYHLGDRVLWCGYADATAAGNHSSGPVRLSRRAWGYQRYVLYMVHPPLPPATAFPSPELARRARMLASSVTIYKYYVDGTIVYSFGSAGNYVVHLRGYVWVKAEENGNREVVNAEELGSYGELEGAMQYLFSECSFNAWAEYNQFAGFIKAKWAIAENVCPYPARYRGRPALELDADGSMRLEPGGPSGGNELGCGCYGWSP